MTKWLGEVMKEAKAVDHKKFRPMDEVGSGEHVIGEVDDECKKLYVLAHEYRRRAAEKRGEARTMLFIESSSKQCLLEEARKMEGKANVLIDIFQGSVREAHDLWGEDIDIKKGWKIVRVKIDEVPNSKRFLFDTHFRAM